MALTSRSPAPGESLACDLCNQTRAWGRYNRGTGKVICVTCCSATSLIKPVDGINTHLRGGYKRPSDASGTPDTDALKHLFE